MTVFGVPRQLAGPIRLETDWDARFLRAMLPEIEAALAELEGILARAGDGQRHPMQDDLEHVIRVWRSALAEWDARQ